MRDRSTRVRREEGFALFSVIMALLVVSVLAAAFAATTLLDLTNLRASTDSATGFYSAEAGLNIRGEEIRAVFQGYSRPSGTSPSGDAPCVSGDNGSGDFRCRSFTFNARNIQTYVVEDPRNNDPDDSDRMITIPPGERFAGLNAIQYRYSVVSESLRPNDGRPEAILEMVFRTRLVPLFQFAAFYNKDLEILPGPNMTLAGPVHVNGDLYVNANATLSILGEVTVSERAGGGGGGLWRGRKDSNACGGTVRVRNTPGSDPLDRPIPCAGRRLVPQSELDAWNGRIETELETITVPPAEEFSAGGLYWREADLILALDLRNGNDNARIIVPNRTGFGGDLGSITVNETLTGILEGASGVPCLSQAPRSYDVIQYWGSGATQNQLNAEIRGFPALGTTQRVAEWSNSFRDRRENTNAGARNTGRVMLEIDVRGLMDCLHLNPDLFNDGPSAERRLDDTSGGGLVWYFTVLGPYSTSASSGYGVRLRNGAYLGASPILNAPEINGLTVVSDQAVFIEGDYNLDAGMTLGTALPGLTNADLEWRPAAVLTDALNILSNNHRTEFMNHRHGVRAASPTVVQAAFLSGTRTTGNQEGVGGQGGGYNGGLENYPIFHENWSGRTFFYRGSFVSLELPVRSTGAWSGGYYSPPVRDWGYDERFNNVENLPPLSPRFVYLLQERFVREFSR